MGNPGSEALVDPRSTPLPTGVARLRTLGWLGFLAGGLGVASLAALVGDEATTQPWLTALGFATAAAIVAGVRLHQPRHQLQWLLLAVCAFLTTVGVVMMPMPSALGATGQGLTGIGSLAGLVGFVLLVRGRIPAGDRAALLDASILASGAGVLIWAFGLAPYVLAPEQGSSVVAIFFFPSLVALALVARMWFFDGAQRPVTRLIVLNVLAANAIILLEILRATVGQNAYVGPYLWVRFAELAFTGAAALHPAMAVAVEHPNVDLAPVGRGRFVALAVALLVNPATLAIEVIVGRRIDPAPYAIGGVVIGLLVIARLGDALNKVHDSLAERESLLDQLRHLVLYDPLTGLPNRTLFNQRLEASVRTRAMDGLLAALMVDIDDFKLVNDTHGHDTGDALLVAIGGRLRTAVRDGDTVARLGGDEFVISVPGCSDPLVPIGIARRILALLAEPFEIDGHHLEVRASVGVATSGPHDPSAADLVRQADIAMYVAKSRGKGRFDVFEPAMQMAAAPTAADSSPVDRDVTALDAAH